MKKISNFLISLIISILIPTGFAFSAMPEIKHIKIDDTINALAIEDHYLPIVSIKIAFRKSGFAFDEENKSGLAFLVASTLDEGAGDMTSLEFKEKLEELASDISFSLDEDNFYISVTSLTENLDETLKLLSIALKNPRFDDEQVNRIKGQLYIMLAKQEEDPGFVAERELKKNIYKNHPYSKNKYGTRSSIEALKKQDLINFVVNHFTKDNIVVSVVGDINPDNFPSILNKHLSSLNKKGAFIPDIPEVPFKLKSSEFYIPKKIPQSIAMFYMPALNRKDPDFYKLYVANHIFGGGGFESRLMKEVRENNGLAYTVYSGIEPLDKGGVIIGYVGSQNDKIRKSLELIKKEITRFKKDGVSKEELEDAKNYLVNSFPLKMTKNSNIAEYLNVIQLDNLGDDFFKKRNEYINQVTISDIQKIADKFFDLKKFSTVVVGGN